MTTGGRPFVDSDLSTRLDAIRVVAAVYVVLHHVCVHFGYDHGLGLLFRFGQEAVIVFFLLSGFVIYVNEAWRTADRGGYYARRLLRLYPPLLAAMALSALVALDNGEVSSMSNLRTLLGTLFMLQDIGALKPGVIIDPYLDNAPLWSLSYEAAFYAVFPFIAAAMSRAPRATVHAVGLSCVAAFLLYVVAPGHWALVASYFAIWWIGALCGRLYIDGRSAVPDLAVAGAYLALLTLTAGATVVWAGFAGVGVYPFLLFRHFATALLFLPVGLWIGRLETIRLTSVAGGPIRWIASISYGLYIFHYPLLIQWRRANGALGFAVATGLLMVLAYLFDRQLAKALRPRPARRVP